MSSKYTIILDKGRRHEYYTHNLLINSIISGKKSTFNHSIKKTKQEWDIVKRIDILY